MFLFSLLLISVWAAPPVHPKIPHKSESYTYCDGTGAPAAPGEVDLDCKPCDAQPPASQRVRREIRSLTDEEWNSVTDAMWILKTTDTATGQARYGPDFKNYDYFLVKHAVNQRDPRGDTGHFGPAFMTWHRGFLLEFELALLSVIPEIGGLPYWDLTLTDNSDMFSPKYFGDIVGNKGYCREDPTEENCQVVGGWMDGWPVTNWNRTLYGEWEEIFSGNEIGQLRSPGNGLTLPHLVRYPKCGMPERQLLDRDEFDFCATLQDEWTNWFSCQNFMTLPESYKKYGDQESKWITLHSWLHLFTAGVDNCSHPDFPISPGPQEKELGIKHGDYRDLASSPNDPVFMFMHAFIDLNNFLYMKNNAERKPKYFNFPVAGALFGHNLNEVSGPAFPFDNGMLGSSPEKPLTNADILCRSSPDVAPYTYDVLVDEDRWQLADQCFQMDVEYKGPTLQTIEGLGATNSKACMELCLKSIDCGVWVFDIFSGTCQLKERKAGISRRGAGAGSGIISGEIPCFLPHHTRTRVMRAHPESREYSLSGSYEDSSSGSDDSSSGSDDSSSGSDDSSSGSDDSSSESEDSSSGSDDSSSGSDEDMEWESFPASILDRLRELLEGPSVEAQARDQQMHATMRNDIVIRNYVIIGVSSALGFTCLILLLVFLLRHTFFRAKYASQTLNKASTASGAKPVKVEVTCGDVDKLKREPTNWVEDTSQVQV